MNKYCLPIIKKTIKEVEEIIEQHKNEYQFFEIWLDYIADITNQNILLFAKKLNNRGIFLFRRKNLEPIHMPWEKRKHMLSLLSKTDSYVDLDITTQQQELDYIKTTQMKLNLLASYHNYKETPDEKILHASIKTMETCNPAIYKIATHCKTPADALRLLTLQQKIKEQKKRHIILGMGEHGIMTRIFGTLWGNEMIFAPQEKSQSSAPGQLTKSELEKILKVVRG